MVQAAAVEEILAGQPLQEDRERRGKATLAVPGLSLPQHLALALAAAVQAGRAATVPIAPLAQEGWGFYWAGSLPRARSAKGLVAVLLLTLTHLPMRFMAAAHAGPW